jgi:hypothetical protein
MEVFLACAGSPLFDVRSKFEINAPTIQVEENLPFEPVPSEENPSKYLTSLQKEIN